MADCFSAENLSFSVPHRTLINDVSLSLSQGELMALIGPNGAGKSTLLRLLTGYLKPASGQCLLAGKPLHDWHPEKLSRRRAVMRQQTQLGFDWPVEAVVGMGRAPWTHHPETAVVREVMQITGCLPLAGRQFAALSGGEQQRVQLARALAQLWCDGEPGGWLFLDEPTSALDLYHQQHLLRLLKTLTGRGKLHVCIVLHDLNLAALWADRVVLLHNGQIVSHGTPEQVLQADTLAHWYGAQVHVGRHPAHHAPQVFLAP
ncbi:TPA: heme ABC transporter ATP-binding protein [Enterobacter soli]|jgi:iron complex transport system ATP-binding protein|uniref:Heme ABC transporter ATP-binding protein n=1 Tax=Enterobacter soli TaxID=885040 RepID=A0AAW8HAG8_9ENTR|nr:heme ABC transporter ATP-binding protein [Enterobacter soli]MDQ2257927.1 heme ABC transporter ATP-binding protein [Enterobacter soli]MDQ2335050.1 heme ABC transporter ATP-binding protein [Enterobacter soli]HEE9786265.1 heme ABC transporter ATP-binding protein [Enterobacter soli]